VDWEKVLKDRRTNLEWRTETLRRARWDQRFRLQMKELFHRDILFAFNAFFYTYDPRKRPLHNLPFITWDYQDGTIKALREAIRSGEDVVLEKSRDMGVSWMVILVFLHEWLDPEGGADFLLGSRIEDYVDKRGDMRTLMEKARYALYRLPVWLRPEGFKKGKHDNYMRLINPETGAIIGGESNNANFSTGGRYAGILFDEFAKWESTDTSAWTAAGDASPCRIAVSTPFGASGKYYELITDGKTKKIRLHWSLHPEKGRGVYCKWPPRNWVEESERAEGWEPEVTLGSPWYEKECERRSSEEIAQELDINYLGSGNPIFKGKAGESLIYYLSVKDEPKEFYRVGLKEIGCTKLDERPQDLEGHLVVYEPFRPEHRYVCSLDTVEGTEDGDYLVAIVFNRITKNVDAVYWSQLDEILAASVIASIARLYSPSEDSAEAPWVGIETNGSGLATFDLCLTMGMTNLFLMPRYDVVKGGVSYKKGWRTDQVSRRELIAGIKEYLIHRFGKLNSHRLVGEMLTFVRSKTGKPQAKSGAHDDMVMAFGIALQIDQLAPLDLEIARRDMDRELELEKLKHLRANPEDFRLPPEEVGPVTIEERCLASLEQMRMEQELLAVDF